MRYLSRKIIESGRVRSLSVLVIDDDGQWRIEPFSHETASTVYVDGPILISDKVPKEPHRLIAAGVYELL